MSDCTAKQRILVAALAITVAVVGLFAPHTAYATEASQIEQLQSDVDDLVSKIEETTKNYQEAEETLSLLEEQIAQNEARAAELESDIPAQRERTAASIRSMYKFQQTSDSLLAIVLTTESFDDFLMAMSYLDAIHSRNVGEINHLTGMVSELSTAKADLTLQREVAQQKKDEALAALEEARDARTKLQARAIAVALSEQDDREAAIAVAREAIAAAEDATFVTSSGNTATVEIPELSSVSTDPLVANITSQESDDWAARINEYLAGSPLEGYGETFAAAAAQYGVDPRLSPAIATIESGKGAICFQDHNAWGWGNSSYDSWESAIYDQVEGLATGYDGTLTLEGAERYCPPNYEEWYSSVANEMNGI